MPPTPGVRSNVLRPLPISERASATLLTQIDRQSATNSRCSASDCNDSVLEHVGPSQQGCIDSRRQYPILESPGNRRRGQLGSTDGLSVSKEAPVFAVLLARRLCNYIRFFQPIIQRALGVHRRIPWKGARPGINRDRCSRLLFMGFLKR